MGNVGLALLAVLLVAGCSAAPSTAPDPSSLEAETADSPVLPYTGESPVPQAEPQMPTTAPVAETADTTAVVLLQDAPQPACIRAAEMYRHESEIMDIHLETLQGIAADPPSVVGDRQAQQFSAYVSVQLAMLEALAGVLYTGNCAPAMDTAFVNSVWADYLDRRGRWDSTIDSCWAIRPHGPCPHA